MFGTDTDATCTEYPIAFGVSSFTLATDSNSKFVGMTWIEAGAIQTALAVPEGANVKTVTIGTESTDNQ